MVIFQWTTPSFAQLPASSAQALFIKYFRKILFPSRTAARAMFSICAQKAHSALDHEVPGREPHQAVGCEPVRAVACPCAAGAARPALIAEPRLLHTVFSSRQLHSACVRSKAMGCLGTVPRRSARHALGTLQCQQATRPEKHTLLPLQQTPPAPSCSLSGGKLHGEYSFTLTMQRQWNKAGAEKCMRSNISYQPRPGNIAGDFCITT